MEQSTFNDSGSANQAAFSSADKTTAIPVIHENVTINKEQVITGKVKIKKTVTEEVQTVNLPVVSEEYEIIRVPVEPKTLEAPPAPMRYEGDLTIIPVIREITVVEKRYEVIEEIHIRRSKREIPLTQDISLRKETITVERETTK
jgi:uncharacterized protein (TIGR02271 family)